MSQLDGSTLVNINLSRNHLTKGKVAIYMQSKECPAFSFPAHVSCGGMTGLEPIENSMMC